MFICFIFVFCLIVYSDSYKTSPSGRILYIFFILCFFILSLYVFVFIFSLYLFFIPVRIAPWEDHFIFFIYVFIIVSLHVCCYTCKNHPLGGVFPCVIAIASIYIYVVVVLYL